MNKPLTIYLVKRDIETDEELYRVPFNIGYVTSFFDPATNAFGCTTYKSLVKGTNLFDYVGEDKETPLFVNEDDYVEIWLSDNQKSGMILTLEIISSSYSETMNYLTGYCFSITNDMFGSGMLLYGNPNTGLYICINPKYSQANITSFESLFQYAKNSYLTDENLILNGTGDIRYNIFQGYCQCTNTNQIQGYISNTNFEDYFSTTCIGGTFSKVTYIHPTNRYSSYGGGRSYFVWGLDTYYNWYSFVFNKPEYVPYSLKTIDDEEIYFSIIFNKENELEYRWGLSYNNYYRHQITDNSIFSFYNYQTGTNLFHYLKHDGDSILFKNGASITLNKKTNNNAIILTWNKRGLEEGQEINILTKSYFGYSSSNYDLYSHGYDYLTKFKYYKNTRSNFVYQDCFYADIPMPLYNISLLLGNNYNNDINDKLDELEIAYNENPDNYDFRIPFDAPVTIAATICTRDAQQTYTSAQPSKNFTEALTYSGILVKGYSIDFENNSRKPLYYGMTTVSDINSLVDTLPDTLLKNPKYWKELLGITDIIEPLVPNIGSGSLGGGTSGNKGGEGDYDDKHEGVINPLPLNISGYNLYHEYILNKNNMWVLPTFLNEEVLFANNANYLNCILGLKAIPLPDDYYNNTQFSSPEENIALGDKYVKIPRQEEYLKGKKLSNNYLIYNLGSYTFTEYFGNFLDYNNYTKIQIYLPFIGYETIDTNAVMGKTIYLVASIDTLSGTIVYDLNVKIEGVNTQLCTWSGNCSYDIPITTESQLGNLRNGALGLVGGSVASIKAASALGLAGTPAGAAIAGTGIAISALTSYNMAKQAPEVSKGNGFNGFSGSMSLRTPYIIITRPKQSLPANYARIKGYPSNITARIGTLQGYSKFKDIHLENIPLTSNEIDELYNILTKDGIIIPEQQ